MKSFFLLFVCLCYTLFSFASNGIGQAQTSLGFIENKGQIAEHKTLVKRPDILYKIEGGGVNAYFKKNSIEYHFHDVKDLKVNKAYKNHLSNRGKDKQSTSELPATFSVYYYRMDLEFINANTETKITPSNENEIYRNYYLAQCPQGVVNVKQYQDIYYANIYKNIDLHYYFKDGKLKYDFILRPGAKVADIQMKYNGANDIHIDKLGNLKFKTPNRELNEQTPYTYNSSKKEIPSHFILNKKNKQISFSLPFEVVTDTTIIDPSLYWSTYFEGVNLFNCEPVSDNNGNIYEATTSYGLTFPVLNAGAGQYFDGTKDGITDLGIYKLNTSLAMEWATYFGGDVGDYSYGQRLAIDKTNMEVYITGRVDPGTTVFPTLDLGGGAFYQDVSKATGEAAFFLRLNTNGVLQWSTIFSHENANTDAGELYILAIQFANNKLYFTGHKYKNNPNDIPFRNLAGAYYNTTYIGKQDPFIGRFSSAGVLEWSTYINSGVGPQAYKSATELSIDNAGNVWFLGNYSDMNNPSAHLFINPGGGAYYNTISPLSGGDISMAYICKFDVTLNPVWATFFGGTGGNFANGIATDQNGNAFLSFGGVKSGNFPVVDPGGGAYYQGTRVTSGTGFNFDAAISKFSPSGVLTWSTYYAGSTTMGADAENAFEDVDVYPNGDVIVSGYSVATDFPTQNLAGSYYKATHSNGAKVVLAKFDNNGVRQWASYFGSNLFSESMLYGSGASVIANPCYYQYIFMPGLDNNDTDYPVVNPGSAYYSTTYTAGSTYNGISLLSDAIPGTQSVAPTSANANLSPVCPSTAVTLSVSGGSLGLGANWQWYSSGCGSGYVGSGSSISVSPTSTTTYYVRAEGTCNITSCASVTVTVNDNSTDPSSASVSASPICAGGSTTISVNGGSLGTGANWQWYSSGCGSGYVGSGTSISVSPGGTTTYYVRAEGTCNNSNCASVTVSVNSNSSDPASASVSVSPICSGASTTLSVNGGSLGTGANWQWYSSGCGSGYVGSGSSISVSPASTTTYYVRAEGTCNNTNCASVTVTVNDNSTDPGSASVSVSPICAGGSTTISVNGGSLGTGANWQWYSSGCGSGYVGTGSSISVSPGGTTTYYVRAEGTCNNTSCVSVTVTVNDNSTDPSSASVSTSPICPGASTTLNVNGGNLGTGANWQWYSGSCGVGYVGSGSSISVSPGSTTTYYVRAEGTCNNSNCVSVTVTLNSNSNDPTSANASVSNICPGNNSSLSVSGGSLGTGANWQWYTGSCGSTLVGTGPSISVSPGGTTTYYVRAEGTCNTTACQSVTVTLNSLSTAATSITASPGTVCPGGSSTLTINGGSLGTGASWQWYNTACGTGLEGSGNSIIVSPTSTTTYYLRAEGTCNTTACVQVSVTAATSVSAAWTAPVSGACDNSPINLDNYVTGTTGGVWSGTGVTGNIFNPSGLANQTVAILYSVGSGNCLDTLTHFIQVKPAPNASWNTPTQQCDNYASINLTNYYTGVTTTGGIWYGTGVSGTTFNPTGLGGQTIAISYAVGSSNGCRDSITKNLAIGNGVSASWTAPTIVCDNAGLINLNSYLAGTATNGGSWNGVGIAVGGNNLDPTGLNGQTILITYVVSNGTCNAQESHSVTINQAPNANWTIPATTCDNQGVIDLTLLYTGTTTTGGIWYGTGVQGTNFDATGLGGQTVTLSYVVSNNGCTDSIFKSISVKNGVYADWNGPAVICSGQGSINLTNYFANTTTPGGTWGGNGVTGNIFDPSGFATGQSVYITYTVSGGGCVDIDVDTIIISTSVNANFAINNTVCDNQGVISNLNSLFTSSTTAGGTWYVNGAVATSLDPSMYTNQSITLSYKVGIAPCSDSVGKTINIIPGVNAQWNFANDTVCDASGPVNLTSLLASSATPGGTWSGQGVNGNVFNPLGLSGSVTVTYTVGTGTCQEFKTVAITVLPTVNASWSVPVIPICNNSGFINLSSLFSSQTTIGGVWTGTGITGNVFDPKNYGGQTLALTYTVGEGMCSQSVTRNLNVPMADTIKDTNKAIVSADCGLSNGSITAIQSSSGLSTYTWYNSNNQVVSTTANLVNVPSGSYYLSLTNAFGCITTNQTAPYVIPDIKSLVADFTFTPNEGEIPAEITFTNTTVNGTKYDWNFGDSSFHSQSVNPKHTYTVAGEYSIRLIADNSNGCYDTAVYKIVIKEIVKYTLPTVFTPNNDGNNDLFFVDGTGLKEVHYQIYNRWGELLFEQNGGAWDGRTASGKLVPQGSYYYIIKIVDKDNNNLGPFMGYVQLIR